VFFLFSKLCRLAMWPTYPRFRWIPGVLLSVVKWLRHEADHRDLSIANLRLSGVIPLLSLHRYDMQRDIFTISLMSVYLHVQGQF